MIAEAPSVDQHNSRTAPDGGAYSHLVGAPQRIITAYQQDSILRRVSAIKDLSVAEPGLVAGMRAADLLSLGSGSGKSHLAELVRASIPEPPPLARPETRPSRRKSIALSPKHKKLSRTSAVRRADSEQRLAACDRFRLQRQWTAAVEAVGPVTFQAIGVTPDNRGRQQRHHLEVPLALVRASDRPLVTEGALFYLCVGQFIHQDTVTPGSLVWFRRRHSLQDVEPRLLDEAERRLATITWTS